MAWPIEKPLIWILSAVIGILSLAIMGLFNRKSKFAIDGQTFVITGGSQGMGLSIAKKLSQQGGNVVIVAQNVQKLENALKAIQTVALHPQSQRFHYISADLRKSAETDRLVTEITAWNNNIAPDSVFLCAGNSLPGYFVDTSSEVLRNQMDSIYWCSANMAHSVLKVWMAPSSGSSAPSTSTRHLIFTCSVLAFIPLAGYAPYTPAKAALRALSDTLNQEATYFNGARLHPSSNTASSPEINVHIVYPGGILSPGFEIEKQSKPALTHILEGDDEPETPDQVADVTISALKRGDYMISINLLGHILKAPVFGFSPSNGLGIFDFIITCIGVIVARFVSWDHLSKCFKIGKKDGREIKGVSVSPYS